METTKMKKIIAAVIAGILAAVIFALLFVPAAVLLGVGVNDAKSEFWQIARYASIGAAIVVARGAYLDPAAIFRPLSAITDFVKKIISLKRLTTPFKRAMFLMFVAGISFLILDIAVYYFNHWNRFFETVPTGNGFYSSYKYFFWFSVTLIVAGIGGSFLYDVTIGHLVRWVKNGRKEKRP